MPKLPRVSGREAIRAFQKTGWDVARQRGSHVVAHQKRFDLHTFSTSASGFGTGAVAWFAA